MKEKITGKKPISKLKILVIIVITLATLIILFLIYCALWRVEIPTGEYLDDYQDYYYMTKIEWRRNWFTGTEVGRHIVYIKIGQKGKMLDKIKEDVTNELNELVAEHGDAFYKYEISDDFKHIYIYIISRDINKQIREEIFRGRPINISSLIELYHNIKDGKFEWYGQIITFIEPDD